VALSPPKRTAYARPTQLVVFALPVTKVLLRDWAGHRNNAAYKRKTTTGLRAGVKKPPASFWKLMETAKMVARGCAGGAAGTPPWLLAGDSTPDRPACLRGYQYIPKVQRPKCPCGLAGHREQSAPINEREPSYPRRAGVNEPLALFLPAGLMRRRPRPPQRNGHVAIRKGRLMARAEEDCSC